MTDAERFERSAATMLRAARGAGMLVSGDLRVGEADAAALLGLSAGGLKNLRLEGDAPAAYRVPVGSARISYRLHDLASWVESRRWK